MKKILIAFLPPVVLAALLACIFILPRHEELVDSAISPQLPLGTELPGWYGERQQESDLERGSLPLDTIFSKAIYVSTPRKGGLINVSIVYSGSDMNSSIHRPERCLPSQGHVELQGSQVELKLANGKSFPFTRLTSATPLQNESKELLRHINYYVFVGHTSICSTHMSRTLRDMYDRVISGTVQRWAYFQVGSYWGEAVEVSQEECDKMLQEFIEQLMPQLVDWESVNK